MLNKDEIKYALQNLMHRKLRSFLSTLSILLGIMSIFALVSFGIGIQKYVDDLAQEAGTDKLFIQSRGIGAPGTDSNFILTQEDVDFIAKQKEIQNFAGIYMTTVEAKLDKQKKYFFIMGIDPKKQRFIEEAFTVGVEYGRSLKKGDLNKVVLGYNYQFENKIFKKALEIGDKITLNDEKYEIVGFYDEVGNPSDDSQIYLTDKAFELLFPEKKGEYGFIMTQLQPGVDPNKYAERLEEKIRKFKDQEKGKEDFYVQSFADALETFGSVFGIITGTIILIAFISLIVAAINIMNTMYTAVLERTKEIGVMKAIGAPNHKITTLFVFESGVLGTIGGIVGMFLGYLIAKAGEMGAAAAGYASLKPDFPIWLIIGCIMFAFFVGSIAGLLPAIQASKLKPVEALRFE